MGVTQQMRPELDQAIVHTCPESIESSHHRGYSIELSLRAILVSLNLGSSVVSTANRQKVNPAKQSDPKVVRRSRSQIMLYC
jgi:hypothetical protein